MLSHPFTVLCSVTQNSMGTCTEAAAPPIDYLLYFICISRLIHHKALCCCILPVPDACFFSFVSLSVPLSMKLLKENLCLEKHNLLAKPQNLSDWPKPPCAGGIWSVVKTVFLPLLFLAERCSMIRGNVLYDEISGMKLCGRRKEFAHRTPDQFSLRTTLL